MLLTTSKLTLENPPPKTYKMIHAVEAEHENCARGTQSHAEKQSPCSWTFRVFSSLAVCGLCCSSSCALLGSLDDSMTYHLRERLTVQEQSYPPILSWSPLGYPSTMFGRGEKASWFPQVVATPPCAWVEGWRQCPVRQSKLDLLFMERQSIIL